MLTDLTWLTPDRQTSPTADGINLDTPGHFPTTPLEPTIAMPAIRIHGGYRFCDFMRTSCESVGLPARGTGATGLRWGVARVIIGA